MLKNAYGQGVRGQSGQNKSMCVFQEGWEPG